MGVLPDEPEIMDARLAFPDAQTALDGVSDERGVIRYTCGWYGTKTHPERGSFCIVNEAGPLVDLVGDRLKLHHDDRVANVYCIGSRSIEEGQDIIVPRLVWTRLEILAEDTIEVTLEVLAG
jgi:hypothetical protein